MTPLALSTSIGILANAVAAPLSDDQLALASALFVQLGDTLATIAVQRSIAANAKNPSDSET